MPKVGKLFMYPDTDTCSNEIVLARWGMFIVSNPSITSQINGESKGIAGCKKERNAGTQSLKHEGSMNEQKERQCRMSWGFQVGSGGTLDAALIRIPTTDD